MEKYGEVPPRFTKKWWEHFWEYYKWHVIITVVALLIAVVTIVQCANRPQYDMVVIYSGYMHFGDTGISKMNEIEEEFASDADGNGKVMTHFVSLEFTDVDGNEEFDLAVQQKLDLTFMDDCTFLYIMDARVADRYTQRSDTAEAFESTEIFTEGSDAECLYNETGEINFAASLKNSTIMKEKGINSENLYVLVRRDNRGGDTNAKAHEDAVKMANALIK